MPKCERKNRKIKNKYHGVTYIKKRNLYKCYIHGINNTSIYIGASKNKIECA